MELFPATDEEQFEFIKSIIEKCDYYIIISAGRYGSIEPKSGLSYTELEYDYACSLGIPVVRLLHRDPFKTLRGELIEEHDDGKEKLRKFREKMAKNALVRFWNDPNELMSEVVFSLMDIQKRKPAVGWVRADQLPSSDAERKLVEAYRKIADLEKSEQRAIYNERFASVKFNEIRFLTICFFLLCFTCISIISYMNYLGYTADFGPMALPFTIAGSLILLSIWLLIWIKRESGRSTMSGIVGFLAFMPLSVAGSINFLYQNMHGDVENAAIRDTIQAVFTFEESFSVMIILIALFVQCVPILFSHLAFQTKRTAAEIS